MSEDEMLAHKLDLILPHLNERQRRLVLAAEAQALGRGGITRVARASGVTRPTIHVGLRELSGELGATAAIRRPGAGRPRVLSQDPTLVADLEALVDPDSRGDPQSPLRWTCKSTRQLAGALQAQGHQISADTVASLLHLLDYSLQAPAKQLEGRQHPDRDAQFRYLNEQTKAFLSRDLPVVSVDTKKKELVGAFRNGGQEWQPQGRPELVDVHDFPDPQRGKAIPYGIYDLGRNTGWVTVGQDHETASFAVASLQRWWTLVGQPTYAHADRLLICADGGGSNGYRVRLWKVALQNFTNATGVVVTICHLPPGTSKWNKIEHRLFAYISMNWRGRPLVSHEVVVELIGATTNCSGLRVQTEFDPGRYPTKIKISDEQLAEVALRPHSFHGEWNYTIFPTVHDIDV